ncbi:MAG TPA: ATP-dependent DNA helicase, partial [Rhodanobacteraceae bacterium]|nr:ATP-dependent DNA helicase [Rhodanobacteraceae bacterium]
SDLRRNGELWVAAERLPQFAVVHPSAERTPAIEAPAEYAATEWTPDKALVEILRSRLTGLGPVRVVDLAESIGLDMSDIDIALAALEGEGYVMRGQFTPGATETEWCERRLLARIHRYTVRRLRREIEPVAPRDFMRFLATWQHVAPDARVSGPDALASVLAQLEGYEAPAAAWESELLPSRVAGYEISWLDDLCLSGRVLWARLRGGKVAQDGAKHVAGPVRATPIVLLQRRHLAEWSTLGGLAPGVEPAVSSRAKDVADYLAEHGASFFDEMLGGTRLLHTELEDALGELVASGLVTSDSFSGLRALLVPSSKRPPTHRRRGRRTSLFGIADAGRWAVVRRSSTKPNARPAGEDGGVAEVVARTLLKRYGVVCWRLLANEAAWLPPWRDLLRVFHKLEARGEIRGGRFIAGLSGEQFALPEAVASLRAIRQKAADGEWIAVCGADPLNLVGSVVAGATVPSVTGSRVLYRDGVPVAKLVAGEVTLLEPMDEPTEATARARLLRGPDRDADVALLAALEHEAAQ